MNSQTHRTIRIAAAIATLLTGAAMAGNAWAQVRVSDTYLPSAELTRSDAPAGPPAEMAMNLFDAGIELPVFARRGPGGITIVSAGLAIRRHTFDLSFPGGDDEFFPRHLYAIDGSVALIKSITRRWYGVGFVAGGLHSDFDNVGTDHLVFEGGGFLVRKLGASLHLGLGPVLTYAFGEPMIIPAPFIRYQGEGKLSIESKFPRYVKVAYAVTPRFELGAAARSIYNNYRVGNPQAMDADGNSPVIVFSDLTVGIESAVELGKSIWLTGGVGSTLHRTLTVNDDGGNELYDRGLKNGLVVTAGLETRL